MYKQKYIVSLQTMITVLVCLVVTFSLLITDILISDRVAESTKKSLEKEIIEISRIISNTPVVIDALATQQLNDDPAIQAYVEKIRIVSGVQFITVMDMNRERKSHPNTDIIGQRYEKSDVDPAFKGQEVISFETGSMGQSLRAFSPVVSAEGQQVGVVLVGMTIDNISQAVYESRLNIIFGICLGLLIGIIGSLLLARYIKQIMFGMEPFTIAKLFEERNAMLNSAREGIIAVDQDSNITIVNKEALRILRRAGIAGEPIGRKIEEYLPNTRLRNVLQLGKPELDQDQDVNGVTLLTNRVPVNVDGTIVGAIATFRDKTEISRMAEQLSGVRTYADALRSQTHEFMNKLHVILGMIRMGCYDRLNEYVNQIAHRYQAEIGFIVKKIKDPVMAGFLLGKLSKAREEGIEMKIAEECFLPETDESRVVHELITIVGNLIDNAMEALDNSAIKQVCVNFSYDEGILTIRVSDSGPGMDDQLKRQIFEKGYSTKGLNRGLGLYLLKHSVDRLDGEIEIISEPGKGTEFCIVLPYKKRGDNS